MDGVREGGREERKKEGKGKKTSMYEGDERDGLGDEGESRLHTRGTEK